MSSLFGDETAKENSVFLTENGQDHVTVDPSEGGGASESDVKNDKEKRPVWLKQKQKRGGNKKTNKKQVTKPKTVQVKQKTEDEETSSAVVPLIEKNKKQPKEDNNEDSNSEESEVSEDEESDDERSSGAMHQKTNEEDDQEWEKLKKLTDREKSLEGKSKISHSVHSPYFPGDKQEYWWTYICDRKSKTLLTMPNYVTNLVDEQVVHLKFTAPKWKAVYTFTACLRSDSYIGFDQQKDIKLDVKEAPKIPEQHPQWEFEDSDDGKEDKAENNESEYTTDEDVADDD